MGILITSEESSGTASPLLLSEHTDTVSEWKSAVESPPSSTAPPSPKRNLSGSSSVEKKRTSIHSNNGSRRKVFSPKPKDLDKLTPKDQKILDVMRQKRETERVSCQRRVMFHSQWEKEKKQEDMVKHTLENIRKNMIIRGNRLQNGKDLNALFEEECKKLEDIDGTLPPDDGSMSYRSDQMVEELIKKEEERARLRNKRSLKKKHQEEKLQQLTQEEELMKRMLQEKQECDLERVLHKKQSMVTENVARIKKTNSERFHRYKTQKEILNTQERDMTESLYEAMLQQQGQVKNNLERLNRERIGQQKYRRRIFDKRLEQSLNMKQQSDKDRWYLSNKMETEQEVKCRSRSFSAQLKAQKAREERMQRESSHASNMKRINECLQLWKEKTAEHLSEKERRLQEMKAAKEQQISEMRECAQRSMILRNKLRQYYDTNNFDKKLLEAQLHTKMGSGVQTAAKNLSSFSLS
ncbi:bromodomain-containing protein DDB_G0280777-like [Argonauta hians]